MLFRFLLYFFIGLMIFRFISSLFRPRRTSRQYTNQHRSSTQRKEGEVSVNLNQNTSKKHIAKDEGDYIDFEEI